jgi:hypothetical protein
VEKAETIFCGIAGDPSFSATMTFERLLIAESRDLDW